MKRNEIKIKTMKTKKKRKNEFHRSETKAHQSKILAARVSVLWSLAIVIVTATSYSGGSGLWNVMFFLLLASFHLAEFRGRRAQEEKIVLKTHFGHFNVHQSIKNYVIWCNDWLVRTCPSRTHLLALTRIHTVIVDTLYKQSPESVFIIFGWAQPVEVL